MTTAFFLVLASLLAVVGLVVRMVSGWFYVIDAKLGTPAVQAKARRSKISYFLYVAAAAAYLTAFWHLFH